MIGKCALVLAVSCLAVLVQTQHSGITWKTIQRSHGGAWTAKATYPDFRGSSRIATFADNAFANTARSMLDEFVAAQNHVTQRLTPTTFTVAPTVTAVTFDVLSGYLTARVDDAAAPPKIDVRAITIGLIRGEPKELDLKEICKDKADLGELESKTILPALNDQRKARGQALLMKLPPRWIDKFAVTKNGLTWLFVLDDDPDTTYAVKVGFGDLRSILDSNGPLKRLLMAGS